MARPTIEPITVETLTEFARFLEGNMPFRRSEEEWSAGLSANWCADRPNYGFLMRDAGRVVGGIGAIYADRNIDGRPERFCNITSWCVLDKYRKFSMQLAMQIVDQPGFHVTDFSPTKIVAASLQFLRFQPLDEAVVVLANFALSGWRYRVESRVDATGVESHREIVKCWRDHAGFAWLRQLLIGRPGHWCHVVYKRRSFKGMPSAQIIYLSDGAIFLEALPALQRNLLMHGMMTTHVERRMLPEVPRYSRVRSGFNAKQFKSDTLKCGEIDYLYSESVALDL